MRTCSSRVWAWARVAGAEVDGVDAGRGELGDGRPGLLGLDREVAGADQALGHRVGDRDGRAGGVAVDGQRAVRLAQLAQPRLGLVGAAIGGVAVVDVRDRLGGDHVVGDPAGDPRHRDDLGEAQPVELARIGRHLRQRVDPGGGAVDRVVGQPRARRVPRAPVEGPRRVDVAQAAGVDGVGGRLHDDHEVGGAQPRLALEQPGERALGDRQLLAPEEHVAEVDRRRPPAPAPARPSPRGRPSCRRRPGRGPRRRRAGPDGCPAPERCRSGPPGARAGAPRAASRRPARRCRPRRGRRRRPRVRTPSTWAARAASSRDSDGTSTSSSVRAARRSARDTPRQATQLTPAGQAVGHGVERAPGRAGPARRACWASCRAGACARDDVAVLERGGPEPARRARRGPRARRPPRRGAGAWTPHDMGSASATIIACCARIPWACSSTWPQSATAPPTSSDVAAEAVRGLGAYHA